MPTSYVEDLAAAALERQGYVVIRNTWIRLPKNVEKHSQHWTDIDILAIGAEDVLICSCKAFLGSGKAATIAEDTATWFDHAAEEIQKDVRLRGLTDGRSIRRVVVLDSPGSRAIATALSERAIEIIHLEDLFVGLVHHAVGHLRDLNPKLAKKDKFWVRRVETVLGKDEDPMRRLILAMLTWDVLKDDVVDEVAARTPRVGRTYSGLPLGEVKVLDIDRDSAGRWLKVRVEHLDGATLNESFVDHEEWRRHRPRWVRVADAP